MISYRQWVKKSCLVCKNEWLEILAVVWNDENGKECSEPCLVCPNKACGTLFGLDEYDLIDDDIQAT